LEPIGSYRLTLIGTVHGDPRGQARAGELLNHLKPDLVTVEISPFSLRYRRQHGVRWQRQLAGALAELPEGAALHLAIRRLAAQVALPFEVRAAQDYSRKAGVPWRPLDLGFVSRRHLPRFGPELLSPANLKALLTTADGELEEFVAAEFRRARLALARPPRRLIAPGVAETARRERFLARRLRDLTSRHRRVVHLGGWEHLVAWQDAPGLWGDLADIKPGRVLLEEADRLPGFSGAED
jgi:pheromone shutdown protein TraB